MDLNFNHIERALKKIAEAGNRPRFSNKEFLDRLTKPMQIRALLLDGLTLSEVAKQTGATESTVKTLEKSLRNHDEKLKFFRELLELLVGKHFAPYKPRMEDLGEIAYILANWNADAVARLAVDLKNGKLGKIYEQASESTPAVIVQPNPSGWVPTGQLPLDVANAIRAGGAIRQRARRSKLSEAEKAEERAKAAARMRAKRSRSPEP